MVSRTLMAVALALVLGSILAVQIARPILRRRRRARLLATPMPLAWRRIVREHLRPYAIMPPALRARLEGLILVFLDEKRFVGCAGLELTDRMRLTIAAQACVLMANRPGGCFDNVQTILVYPEAFYVDHEEVDEAGVVHRDRHLRSGEAWEEGQVVIAWDDALEDHAYPEDGQNVVMHEFAHQLDGQSGSINGAPPMSDAELARWSDTMRTHFDALNRALDRGQDTFIDPYAASDPTEFFAVVTEHFFELPLDLRTEHPDLYARLSEFYRIDPASWPLPTSGATTEPR